MYDSLHKVTAILFSENPKNPAMIISSFRKESKTERPVLKAAFINGDVYMGNDQLKALEQIKTKNELIGEVIGLLQSPAKRVLAALLHHHEKQANGTATEAPKAEAKTEEAPKAEAAPQAEKTAATDAAAPAGETTAPGSTETDTNAKGETETPAAE
jgi:large subunit ribosomal protein L10